MKSNSASSETSTPRPFSSWVYFALLVYILIAGAIFRFSGLLWGENQYLHPDERFLVWVGSDIQPVKSLAEYFDSANSTLNPQNTGHSFYVYGTLPMFITRYVVQEIFKHSGFDEMTQVGRTLSAIADLLTVLLIYLAAERLYNRRVGILAAAFSAATVLQIQQSHFFTMDTFINAFTFLAFYLAVCIATLKASRGKESASPDVDQPSESTSPDADQFPETTSPDVVDKIIELIPLVMRFVCNPLFILSLAFGAALGMAVASKINAIPVAITLPLAMLIVIFRQPPEKRSQWIMYAMTYLGIAALTSLLVFRIFQPYAFSGPGFFGMLPNQKWLANIKELIAQSGGDVDYPPNMQWARRPIWFSWQNMVVWGMGLPLGLLAWAGFLWAGWRLLTGWQRYPGEWQRHTLIWLWTAVYFGWQSLARNPTMRYQLPVYPTLAIFAAWAIITLYDYRRKSDRKSTLGDVDSGDTSKGVDSGSTSEDVDSGNEPEGVDTKPTSGDADSRVEPENSNSEGWGFRLAAVLIGIVVLVATYAYAYAFTGIYTQPITRVAATRWIYQNIPGPINLPIQTSGTNTESTSPDVGTDGIVNQILFFPYDLTITSGSPYSQNFTPKAAGTLSQVILPRVKDTKASHEVRQLTLTISASPSAKDVLATATLVDDLTPTEDPRGKSYTLNLDHPVQLDPDKSYSLHLELAGEPLPVDTINGQITLHFIQAGNEPTKPIDQPLETSTTAVQASVPFSTHFIAAFDGYLTQLSLAGLADQLDETGAEALKITLQLPDSSAEPLVSNLTLLTDDNSRDCSQPLCYTLLLDPPLPVYNSETYGLVLELQPQGGAISLIGMGIANEGDWDDGLPLRMDGYDGFGGIYPADLNFNMYWDDNAEKLARFERILDQADYLLITSSRQWGSLPRMPERFPMTTIYYRNLIGCPAEQEIEDCYRVAQPGTFQGNLGYELVQVFDSSPSLGSLRFNDQFAEEAFTVYDHPKVFIFKKTAGYDSHKVQAILGQAEFDKVIRIPPMRYESQPANLMLPDYRLAEQQQGGTWAELFDPSAPQNRFQPLAVLLWYLSVGLLGLIVYPLLRLGLPGLADGGYPLARTAGMLLLSYLAWLAGSFNIPFSRLTISAALLLMLLAGSGLAYLQRETLRQEWQSRRTYFLLVEGLTLALFIAFLLIRLGNPDLWHPWKGGEKPMDLSYFTAVLKSTTFPPYDPWYAGGYLNYYYYGFVLVGTLVKWLGIAPSIAYNLILPTLFSMIAMGAFSIVWNISHERQHPRLATDKTDQEPHNTPQPLTFSSLFSLSSPLIPACAAALGTAILGNLGTVRMIFQGWQKLVAPGGVIEGANLLTRWGWAAQGFVKAMQGADLPYGLGDWYWIPSRAIPAPGDVEPITEFPFFTALYADPHAHLYALPITLLALACLLAFVLGKGRWSGWLSGALGFFLTGLAVGALRPTNTWDFYTYLVLGSVVLGYVLWVNYRPLPDSTLYHNLLPDLPFLQHIPAKVFRPIITLGGVLLFVFLSYVLYEPYAQWYMLGYNKVELWKGTHTPLSAYLTHWGLFLFLIVSWMAWETLDWMARTPISALRKLQRSQGLILAGLIGLLLVIVLLVAPPMMGERRVGAPIAWFVLPLAAWAGILLLRPGQPDVKRLVLFIVGTGLALTLLVEVMVIKGDIGRMNMVFKFYLQTWTFFAISAAAGLGWLMPGMPKWSPRLRTIWHVVLALLVASASLYTLMASMAKIKDRMIAEAPHTLDGMDYMAYATYAEEWGSMDLSQDYNAIRWMQENVSGSPVIVEANLRNLYRWGSRYSIYTGLPGVVGWEWHQQQQRGVVSGAWVSQRIAEVDEFYKGMDLQIAMNFLRKYQVRYIILGQQERGIYAGPGLQKFSDLNGLYWREVYREGDTIIYEVIEQ